MIPAADRANEIRGMDTITRSQGLLLLLADFFQAELKLQWSVFHWVHSVESDKEGEG